MYFQGTNANEIEDIDFFKNVLYDDNLRGIFTPRYELFKIVKNYDYVILIDDDLYMYPDTSYENAMNFLDFYKRAGCCNISTHRARRKNKIEKITRCYNVDGGMIFPKKSVELILDYFKDKEADYTEDMFWLLLWIKGYDLYRDWSSNAIHVYNVKDSNKKPTGFEQMRRTKPYLPIFTEWFNEPQILDKFKEEQVRNTKELMDVNEKGLKEREHNLKRWQDQE